MVEARGNAQDTGTEKIDFEAIENEIDKEIDSLFIPAAKLQIGAEASAENPNADAQTESGDGGPATPRGVPAGSVQEEFASGSLEAAIDREVDALFVPVSRRTREEKTREDASPSPKTAGEAAGQSQPPQTGLESHADFFPSGPSPAFRTSYGSREELPKLVEVFNAAYLSLDWEFSPQNIKKLESALSDLDPFAGSTRQSAPIFKMLKVILARLRVRPQLVNNPIIELIRDSQGLLAHMLLMEEAPGPDEKGRIKSLLSRFRQMREKALAAREVNLPAGKQKSTDDQPFGPQAKSADEAGGPILPSFNPSDDFAEPSPGPESGHELSAPPAGAIPDSWSFLELKEWMESSGRFLLNTIEGFETEIHRMRKVETALGKSPGLLPVVGMLADIRAGVERGVVALREQEGGWSSRVAWVENLEKVSSACDGHLETDAEKDSEPMVADVEAPAGVESQARREDVCLFRYAGRAYAVFFPNMVRYSRVSRKLAAKILARGYATLDEVKPFCRGIRNGVLGEWAAMPRKALQSIKFSLIGPAVFQAEKMPADPRMAIFLNLGDSWGVILSDSDKIDFRAGVEIKEEPCSCQAALGTVRTESGLCAEVLAPGRVANAPGESVEG